MPDQSDNWGHWEHTKSEPGQHLNIFTSRYDTFVHPVTKKPLRAIVLETPPWCNVVAVTPDSQLVMVRQFRFGIRDTTLEVPGGMVDPGEEHLKAAQRELVEETGFTSTDWKYLGSCYQNPAFQDELCHFWKASDAKQTQTPAQDGSEHIRIELMSPDSVRQAVADGTIQHPHGIVALSRVLDLRVV